MDRSELSKRSNCPWRRRTFVATYFLGSLKPSLVHRTLLLLLLLLCIALALILLLLVLHVDRSFLSRV